MEFKYEDIKQGMKLILNQYQEKSKVIIAACDTVGLIDYLAESGQLSTDENYDGILYCDTEEIYEQIKHNDIEEKYNDIKRIKIEIFESIVPNENRYMKNILEKLDD